MMRSRREPSLVSIIILAHNKSALTRACLDALVRAPGELEIVLVDNASTDDTPAVARRFERRLRRFHLRRSARNLPFAVANNRAVRDAQGDLLLFLNNDVIVAPDAPARLARAVGECDGGIVGPKLLFADQTSVQHAGMKQMLWGYASNLGTGGRPDDPPLNEGGEIFAVTGAMLAIGRALFERIGGFDERYRWGYEDVDLCLKARQAGALVCYAPEIDSIHAESATLGSTRRLDDLRTNYGLYRRRWNHVLVPAERAMLRRLQRERVRRVVIFGTGLAGRGLARILTRAGIDVVGFTASTVTAARYCGRPVASLEDVRQWRFDRLIVGSQHYFALRARLDAADPVGEALFPALDLLTSKA
jgi:GT2 family glycosyltransferase